MTIDRAIETVRDRYKYACQNPNIHDPVSYALYAAALQSDREFVQLYLPEIEKQGEEVKWFE